MATLSGIVMLTTYIKKLAGFQVFKFSLYYNLLIQ